jgi:hypothetical protein
VGEGAMTWDAHELAFESARERIDPYLEVDVRVEWTSPTGRTETLDSFWDGGRTWRARARLDEPGTWSWRSTCSDGSDAGLAGLHGTVECDPYDGPNPLYRHGPVTVSADGRHFEHRDGTPFFWLGDTAWNGVLRADPDEWDAFLAERSRRGFSVVQFFGSTWRGFLVDDHGEPSCTVTDRVRVNPSLYRRLDPMVRAINGHGMLAYAIGVLALFEDEPAWAWPEADLERFIRYLDARWGAYHMAWSPIGDGDYSGDRVERVKRLCRAVYEPTHRNLVTVHPKGWSLYCDEYRDESWFDFVSYQSCHDDTVERLRWHPFGPIPDEWRRSPARPIVNVEFNYEAHPSFTNRRVFTTQEVRRAAWWSLLISPPAGVSYGHYHEWSWSDVPEPVGVSIRHQSDIMVGPWRQAIDTPGVRSMTTMRRFFESGPWWLVRPAPELLLAQPGTDDATRFIAVGRTEDGAWTMAYAPVGDSIILTEESMSPSASARWFDPRTGHWRPATAEAATTPGVAFRPPDDDDWVLDIRG